MSRFEFQQFVEAEVAPRWKEGFTILEGQGLWLSEQRGITEREPSRVLVRFHNGGAEASAGVEAIRNAYIRTFEQDAALRTDRMTCADFQTRRFLAQPGNCWMPTGSSCRSR